MFVYCPCAPTKSCDFLPLWSIVVVMQAIHNLISRGRGKTTSFRMVSKILSTPCLLLLLWLRPLLLLLLTLTSGRILIHNIIRWGSGGGKAATAANILIKKKPPDILTALYSLILPFPRNTGEDKYVSPTYVIEKMDRHKGGVYICTANNGVGHIAMSQINLHVLCKLDVVC